MSQQGALPLSAVCIHRQRKPQISRWATIPVVLSEETEKRASTTNLQQSNSSLEKSKLSSFCLETNAYNQMVSGFVISVWMCGKCVAVDKVHHSQQMNDPLVNIWIIAEKVGMILALIAYIVKQASLLHALTSLVSFLHWGMELNIWQISMDSS